MFFEWTLISSYPKLCCAVEIIFIVPFFINRQLPCHIFLCCFLLCFSFLYFFIVFLAFCVFELLFLCLFLSCMCAECLFLIVDIVVFENQDTKLSNGFFSVCFGFCKATQCNIKWWNIKWLFWWDSCHYKTDFWGITIS